MRGGKFDSKSTFIAHPPRPNCNTELPLTLLVEAPSDNIAACYSTYFGITNLVGSDDLCQALSDRPEPPFSI
jgi:hypothetical protein